MTDTINSDGPTLPLRPGTATLVLEMLNDPDTSAAEIGAVVKTEPAITARLLALANSPIFHRKYEITSADRAVIVVGLSTVRGIALGVAMDSFFEDDNGLDPAHWEHATITAGAALAAARHLGVDSGEAFCAGLMLDIGQIAMALTAPDEWARVLEESEVNTPQRLGLEDELLGTNHAQLGCGILTELGLPSLLTDAVNVHHEPLEEIATPLARCLGISAVVAEVLEREESESDPVAGLETLLPDLGVDAKALLQDTQEQIADLRVVLSG